MEAESEMTRGGPEALLELLPRAWEEPGLQTPGFRTSGLLNFERKHSRCLRPLVGNTEP